MGHRVVLLPGIVLPAELAYADLIECLGEAAEARAKELEVYAAEKPPPYYSLELELEGVERVAERAGFERFHLVGYSGGGAVAAAFAARFPGRLESLALLEAAWVGNEGHTESEREIWREIWRIGDLPPDEMMARFVELQLAPGVDPPPPPPGPPPPWMAQRPAGIEALAGAFRSYDLPLAHLAAFEGPVLYVLGGRSNPNFYEPMATRLADVFADYRVEVFPERHHFEPPHRFEPERLAALLTALWEKAGDRS